jgi:hypothetical protein
VTVAADIQACLVTGSNQPTAIFEVPCAALQRQPSVDAAREVHAGCHEAAVQFGEVRWGKWLLYGVLRS